MQILWFLFLSVSISANTLVMIGGGRRPEAALKAMLKATKKVSPQILVLPWGTQDPKGACQDISDEFNLIQTNILDCVLATEETSSILNVLRKADLLYFPGGDQNQIMTSLRQHNLIKIIQQSFKNGLVIGGTSAGTAIQSDPMLTGFGSETAQGLGLSPVIVDQHFLKRNRQERLLSVLNTFQGSGLGIDENMAVVIDQGRLTVFGPTEVWLYSWPRLEHPIKLKDGQSIIIN